MCKLTVHQVSKLCNNLQVLGVCDNSQVPRAQTFYCDTIALVLDSLRKVCRLISWPHAYSQSELGNCSFCDTYICLAILVISMQLVFSIIKVIGLNFTNLGSFMKQL